MRKVEGALRSVALVIMLTAAGCSAGSTGPAERTATVTSGTCGCCGHIVDVGSAAECADPKTCAPWCGDASSDAPAEGDPGD
jgi:hypothetical protein